MSVLSASCSLPFPTIATRSVARVEAFAKPVKVVCVYGVHVPPGAGTTPLLRSSGTGSSAPTSATQGATADPRPVTRILGTRRGRGS